MSGSVLQSGAVTPGHIVAWGGNGTVVDGGGASTGGPFLPLTGGTLTGPFSANFNAFDMTASNPGFVYALGAQVGGITGTLAIPQNYGVVSFRNKGAADTVRSPYGGGVSLLAVNFLTGGSGVTGNRTGEQVLMTISSPTGNKAAGYSNGFYGAAAWSMAMQSGDGGTDFSSSGSYGHVYAINPVVGTTSGATFLSEVFGAEFDIAVVAGSSTRAKNIIKFVQLANDAVQAGAPDADGPLYIANAPGAVGWRDFGLAFGSPYSQWAFGSAAALIKVYQDQGAHSSVAKWGVDMAVGVLPSTGNAYDGGFFKTNGASMDGAGMLRLGTTYLTPGSTGLAIDAKGSVGASATVAAGGSNWTNPLFATDPYGGFWKINAASGGAATSLFMIVAPTYPSTTPPSNPIALTPYGTASIDYGATGLTANITWNTTRTTLSLQPSGGATVFGGPVTLPSGTTGPFLPLTGGILTGPLTAPVDTSTVIATTTMSNRRLADRFADVVNVRDFGAVFDGASHPLSAYYPTLAAAQAVYPHAVALTDEIDGVAIQAAINLCQSRVTNYSYGGTVTLPCGNGLVNQPLTISKQNVSLISQGAEFMMNSNIARAAPSAPTRLTWTGAPRTAGQAQINMLTVAPTDGNRLLSGTNVRGILFYINGVAGASGPLIASVRHASIECATYEPAGIPYAGASLTAGSQAVAVSSTSAIRVGESVVSASLPAGAYVASIADGTHFNASVQASATSTETVTIGGTGIRFDVVDGLNDSNDAQFLRVRFCGLCTRRSGECHATSGDDWWFWRRWQRWRHALG